MSCDKRPHIGTKEPMEAGMALAEAQRALAIHSARH